ncbi:MipA/OmpV family protein [Rhizobium phaseoli]|uniref:MipA/OmpV family protein n=1 Tax=Rhizobium phaseoli TaxID=396 RepID=UPI0032B2E698
MRNCDGITGLLTVISVLQFTASVAQASETPINTGTSTTWIVTLGGSVEHGPKFPGSKHDGLSAMPSFDVRRFDTPDENSAPDDNIDYGLIDIGGFEIGPVLGLRDSRSQSDDARLEGMHPVHWGVDAGVFMQYWAIPDHLRFRSETRQAVSNGSGLVVDFGADWFKPLGDKLLFSAGPRLSVGNGVYMQKYFGISSTEAARNGALPAFDAQSGLKSIGFTASAAYDVSPTWTLQLYDRFDRLTGDAAGSPITSKLGSKNQNVTGISLSKAFNVSF